MARATLIDRSADERRPTPAEPARSRWLDGHVLGAITLAAALALLWLAWQLARPLALVLAAVILANALVPVVDRLARWMRRSFAIAMIYIGLIVLLIVAGALVVPSVMDQANVLAQDFPTLMERGQQLVDRWRPMVSRVESTVGQSVTSGGGGTITRLPIAVMSSALEIVLVVFLSLYWLLAMPTLRDFVVSLVPPARVDETRALLREVGETMGGYVRGVLMEAALISALVFVGMSLLGVPYAGVLAFLSGLGEIVPVVGPILAAAPAILLALLESPTLALMVLGFYVALQLVEGYVLFPIVVGSQSEIPPLLIIVGLVAGGAVGGALGALVAIPLAGALRVVVVRLVAPAIRRRTWAPVAAE